MKIFNKYFSFQQLGFILLLSLFVLLRILVLVEFNFKITDTDQVLMWLGAHDYSLGIFKEPRFYGQSYNSFLEGFLAVPLLKLGIPVFKAVPIVTATLASFPFLLISFVVYIRKSKNLAMLGVAISLALPLDYFYITSMPRGFVTGIFVVSFLFLFLFRPLKKTWFFWIFFLSILGYSLNPNSVLLSIPLLVYFTLPFLKDKKVYLWSGLGILVGLILHFGVASFYYFHPFYELHELKMSASLEIFIKSISDLDGQFRFVVPYTWTIPSLILVFFGLFAVFFYFKKEKPLFASILALIGLILFSLVFSKVLDGFDGLYLPKSRLFLALPLTLIFFLVVSKTFPKWILYGLSVLTIPACILTFQKFETFNTQSKNMHVISLEVKLIKKECRLLKSICAANNVDLVVHRGSYMYDALVNACPTCEADFPNTLRPDYERRTWRLLEDEKRVYRNVLIIDVGYDYHDAPVKVRTVDSLQGFHLVEGNSLPTMKLLEKLKIPVRAYK